MGAHLALMAGDTVVAWNAPAVLAAVEAAALVGLREAGEASAKVFKGRIDTAYPPASSPGEPPHKRSGALGRSVSFHVDSVGGPTLHVGVFPGAEAESYARLLQGGTGRMRPRPFLAQIAVTSLANAAVERAVAAALRRF